MNYSLEGTIDRYEEDKAVIKFKNGSTLIWPKEKLPSNTTEGKVVKISLTTDEMKTEENSISAKELLNDILQSE